MANLVAPSITIRPTETTKVDLAAPEALPNLNYKSDASFAVELSRIGLGIYEELIKRRDAAAAQNAFNKMRIEQDKTLTDFRVNVSNPTDNDIKNLQTKLSIANDEFNAVIQPMHYSVNQDFAKRVGNHNVQLNSSMNGLVAEKVHTMNLQTAAANLALDTDDFVSVLGTAKENDAMKQLRNSLKSFANANGINPNSRQGQALQLETTSKSLYAAFSALISKDELGLVSKSLKKYDADLTEVDKIKLEARLKQAFDSRLAKAEAAAAAKRSREYLWLQGKIDPAEQAQYINQAAKEYMAQGMSQEAAMIRAKAKCIEFVKTLKEKANTTNSLYQDIFTNLEQFQKEQNRSVTVDEFFEQYAKGDVGFMQQLAGIYANDFTDKQRGKLDDVASGVVISDTNQKRKLLSMDYYMLDSLNKQGVDFFGYAIQNGLSGTDARVFADYGVKTISDGDAQMMAQGIQAYASRVFIREADPRKNARATDRQNAFVAAVTEKLYTDPELIKLPLNQRLGAFITNRKGELKALERKIKEDISYER